MVLVGFFCDIFAPRDFYRQDDHQLYMSRNSHIDILRGIGLSLIILAHVNPPDWLMQLRCFDVPLMVFISGLSYAEKRFTISAIPAFLWARTKRLLIPVYIFLLSYFLLNEIVVYCFQQSLGIELSHLQDSLLLLQGIGYVWIIRIFLLVALLTPLLVWVNGVIHADDIFFLFLILSGILLTFFAAHFQGFWLDKYLYPSWGYGILFLLGIRQRHMESSRYQWVLWLAFIALIGCMLYYFNAHGAYIPFNKYKYPPVGYFLLWGAVMSMCCWFFRDRISSVISNSQRLYRLVLFLSANSIWIYLWHIPFVKRIDLYGDVHWMLKYAGIYVSAVAAYAIQWSLVNMLDIRLGDSWKRFSCYLKG